MSPCVFSHSIPPASLCFHAKNIIVLGHLFPNLTFSSNRKFCLIFGALPTSKLQWAQA